MISRLRPIDRSDSIQPLYRREMRGAAAVHILRERFVVRHRCALSLHAWLTIRFYCEPVIIVVSWESTFQGLAIESFRPVPVLNPFPGKLH